MYRSLSSHGFRSKNRCCKFVASLLAPPRLLVIVPCSSSSRPSLLPSHRSSQCYKFFESYHLKLKPKTDPDIYQLIDGEKLGKTGLPPETILCRFLDGRYKIWIDGIIWSSINVALKGLGLKKKVRSFGNQYSNYEGKSSEGEPTKETVRARAQAKGDSLSRLSQDSLSKPNSKGGSSSTTSPKPKKSKGASSTPDDPPPPQHALIPTPTLTPTLNMWDTYAPKM